MVVSLAHNFFPASRVALKFNRHHPFTPSQGSMPSNHNFIGVEMDGLHRKCDVCNKKVVYTRGFVVQLQKDVL